MGDIKWDEVHILVYIIVISSVAGVIAEINAQKDKRTKMSITRRFCLVVINALTSGFVGVLTYWLYAAVSGDPSPRPMMFFIVAVSGWIGGNAMPFFIAIWKAFMQAQKVGK